MHFLYEMLQKLGFKGYIKYFITFKACFAKEISQNFAY